MQLEIPSAALTQVAQQIDVLSLRARIFTRGRGL